MDLRQQNVTKILLEILEQRGYSDIVNCPDRILSIDLEGNQVCTFPTIIQKLNVKEIGIYISEMKADKSNHIILVYEGAPTSAVKTTIARVSEIELNIELFHADDLQYNITKHSLASKHFLLGKEEAKNFREKIGINIPKLLRADPISKFYDYHKGDIVKVVREEGISYRIVV